MNSFLHVFHALEGSPTSAATARKPYMTSQSENEVSPTAGPRTAGAGTSEHDELVVSQYRQSIYGYEQLINRLHDLLPENVDAAYDLVHRAYLEING